MRPIEAGLLFGIVVILLTFILVLVSLTAKATTFEGTPEEQHKALQNYKGPYRINPEVLEYHKKLYSGSTIEVKPMIVETDPLTRPGYYKPKPPVTYQFEWPVLPKWPYIGKTRWVWGMPPNLKDLLRKE